MTTHFPPDGDRDRDGGRGAGGDGGRYAGGWDGGGAEYGTRANGGRADGDRYPGPPDPDPWQPRSGPWREEPEPGPSDAGFRRPAPHAGHPEADPWRPEPHAGQPEPHAGHPQPDPWQPEPEADPWRPEPPFRSWQSEPRAAAGAGAPPPDGVRPRRSAAAHPVVAGEVVARGDAPPALQPAPDADPDAVRVPEPYAFLAHPPVPFPDAAADAPDGGRSRRRKRRRGRKLPIALGVLVLAAAGGGSALAFGRPAGIPVAARQLALGWQAPAPAADDELIGSWLTGDRLVRASTRDGVTARGVSDGRRVWRTAAPRGAAVPCAMSPAPAHGIGTVAFGPDPNTCTVLAGVDTRTGRIRWTLPLTDAKHPVAGSVLTFVQGSVATVVGGNVIGGVDLRTGAPVWGYHPRGRYCNADPTGTEGVVIVDDYCADRSPHFALTAYDAATGAVRWRRGGAVHTDVARVLAADPLTASLHTAVDDSVRVLGASGAGRKLAVGDTEVVPGNDSDADHASRVVDGVLVAPATTAKGPEVDGYDLVTGRKLWAFPNAALASGAGGDPQVHAVTLTGTRQVLRLAPRTGRAVPEARLPSGGHPFTSGTVYVLPGGGVLELPALGTEGPVRYAR